MATTAKRKGNKALIAPVDPRISAKAKELVDRYQIIVRHDPELDGYAGRGAELPNALGFGETAEECIAEVRGNMEAIVIHMLERGETPPLMGDPQRTLQVNIRVTDFEKSLLESLAKESKQSLSDYIRAAALGR